MGYKVLFWRQSWWGYPKAHQKRKMVPSKPSGVIGEDSDIREDRTKVRTEVMCKSPAYPHIKSMFLAIWSNLGETIVRDWRGENRFSSSFSMECFIPGAQIWVSPKEATYKGQKSYDLFTSFVLEESGVTGLGGKSRAQDFPAPY